MFWVSCYVYIPNLWHNKSERRVLVFSARRSIYFWFYFGFKLVAFKFRGQVAPCYSLITSYSSIFMLWIWS